MKRLTALLVALALAALAVALTVTVTHRSDRSGCHVAATAPRVGTWYQQHPDGTPQQECQAEYSAGS